LDYVDDQIATGTALDPGYVLRVDGQALINGDLTVSGQIKEVKNMMGLYDVYVVDTKKGKVIIHNEVVAKDEDKARIRVAIGHTIDLVPDSIEFFVRCIGTWEDKKPREVKIVKE